MQLYVRALVSAPASVSRLLTSLSSYLEDALNELHFTQRFNLDHQERATQFVFGPATATPVCRPLPRPHGQFSASQSELSCRITRHMHFVQQWLC
jgi:hypothetical protein